MKAEKEEETLKIGFIGLGIMGEAMCENIIRKHDDQVCVFDQMADKMQPLLALGACGCQSVTELASCVDLILTMVPKSEHVKAVYQELLPLLTNKHICIDMSTIDPAVSIELAKQVAETGACFADAPVVKSRPAAEKAELGIYVGCEEALYPTIQPVLAYMGSNIIRMGNPGMGLVMKICHNTLVAQIQNGVNETYTLAQSFGIPMTDFVKAIGYGGGQNFYLDSKASNIEKGEYPVAFSVENMHKDLHICHTLAKQAGLHLPGMLVATEIYDEALQQGLGSEDFSATVKVVQERGLTS